MIFDGGDDGGCAVSGLREGRREKEDLVEGSSSRSLSRSRCSACRTCDLLLTLSRGPAEVCGRRRESIGIELVGGLRCDEYDECELLLSGAET